MSIQQFKLAILLLILSLALPTQLFSADATEKMMKDREKAKDYLKDVHAVLMEHWTLPSSYTSGGKRPSATVEILINDSGKITSYKLMRKSGDASFDEACEKAIAETKKLPVPPTILQLGVLKEGFRFVFSPGLIKFAKEEYRCVKEGEKIGREGYKGPWNFKDDPYIAEMVQKIKKKYNFSQYDQRRIVNRMTGVTDKLEAVFGFKVDSQGLIQDVEVVCPSQISYFDDLVVQQLKDIEKIPPPPSQLQGQDGYLKFLWSCTMYKSTY